MREPTARQRAQAKKLRAKLDKRAADRVKPRKIIEVSQEMKDFVMGQKKCHSALRANQGTTRSYLYSGVTG